MYFYHLVWELDTSCICMTPPPCTSLANQRSEPLAMNVNTLGVYQEHDIDVR